MNSPTTPLRTFLTTLLSMFLASLVQGQGSAADYLRADALRELTRDKVAGLRAELTWSPDQRHVAWLRADSGRGQSVRTVELESGANAAAFDHAAIAASCAAGGWSVSADSLPVRGLAYTETGDLVSLLVHAGELRVVHCGSSSLQSVTAHTGAPFQLEPRPAGQTRGGRGETSIYFINSTEQAARIEWIDHDGQRTSRGVVAVGATEHRPTYVGHVWELVREDGESLAFYEAVDETKLVFVPARPVIVARESRSPKSQRKEREERRGRLRVASDGVAWLDARDDSRTELTLQHAAPGERLAGPVMMSPNETHAVLFVAHDVETREVHFVESTPSEGLQPELHSFDYAKPGDELETLEPILFDVEARELRRLDDALFPNPWRIDTRHWSADGEHFYFRYNQRGHQLMRWLELDVKSAQVRSLIDETSATFLDYSSKGYCKFLPERDELLWMSERSGFNHLYRFVASSGELLGSVTSGAWVLRAVERVDEQREEIWFEAMGVYPEQDPYHVHFGRVKFDGSELTWLTSADGTHELDMAPDGAHYVDSYSRVDLPSVHELRRVRDGSLVTELGRADAAQLVATGWQVPERFHAPGRDGTTAIWGVIFKPTHFDPEARYPVIEKIYAGPHGAHVPKSFQAFHGAQALAELGFVVVQIDGMGTNWRAKAFHDVAWKDLADGGFPDRIAWMRAAAATRPWMDLERVGIFGGSAGGQNAMRAVLDHHDFYRAAAADCGCHDNRMDKVWWNEAWMGWPIDDSYAASSNAVDAHKLGAPLLLTVGELDRNVDPASTMQVVKALIDADKDFELIVFPGRGHGAGDSAYGVRRRRDFFVRHLLGVQPRWTE